MKSVLTMILALTLSANTFAAEPKSVYTPLSCKETRSGLDPIDYFYSKCTGYAGYDLRHNGADSRDWLSIVINKKKHDLFIYNGSFPYVAADKIEWRGYAKADGQVEPYAIIFRVRADKTDTLVVARVSRKGACVIGSVTASHNKNANQEARDLADRNSNQACSQLN